MRIAIITFFENGNLGSELQAYALREFCKSMGHNSYLCAIKPRNNYQKVALKIKRSFISFFVKIQNTEYRTLEKAIKNNLKYQYVQDIEASKIIKKWSKAHNDMVALTKAEFLTDKFDYYICGSDQIWSPAIIPIRTELYLKGIKSEKKIAYAPSFGMDWIPQYYTKRVFPLIADFKALSFRENTSVQICEEKIGVNAEFVLDPTLLVGRNFWDEKIAGLENKCNITEEDFYLCYFLGKPCKETLQELDEIGHKNIIYTVNNFELAENICNAKNIQVNPLEFVNLIKKAKYVLTDSFHGTVFSIMYHRRIFIYQRVNNPLISQKSRINSLLMLLAIEKKQCKTERALELGPEDYERADEIIKIYQEKSSSFLKKALGI